MLKNPPHLFAFLTVALFSITAPANAASDTYDIDPRHSSVRVVWDYSGMVDAFLTFTEFEGVFQLDLEAPENSTVDVSIPISSMWTAVPSMTENLQSQWYFDAENYPTARFVAKKFVLNDENTGTMIGALTIKDKTHEVSFDVKLNYKGEHPLAPFRDNLDGVYVAGFSAHGVVSRAAFDLARVRTIGDDIDIYIEAAFERRNE